ncbi:MAG: hypothetical protein K2O61_08875 [Bacteroidaceae bacterium]|nr:hypothetical protein [Bacteroidaceae bacterium]
MNIFTPVQNKTRPKLDTMFGSSSSEREDGVDKRMFHPHFSSLTSTPLKAPLNRSPRLRPTDVPDSDQSESGTSI